MKNKKSLMVLSAIVRIILAIVLFIFVFVACTMIKSAFFSNDDKYTVSFVGLVNSINDMNMKQPKKTVPLETKEESAIIGFRKDGAAWECNNCNPTKKFVKPSNQQCDGNACACICIEGFKGSQTNIECQTLICRTLTKDIKDETIIDKDKNIKWINGFLFVNGMDNVNGLPKFRGTQMDLFIDDNNDVISVCNADMREYNKRTFKYNKRTVKSDTCITPKI